MSRGVSGACIVPLSVNCSSPSLVRKLSWLRAPVLQTEQEQAGQNGQTSRTCHCVESLVRWICLGEICQGCRKHQRGEILTADVLFLWHAAKKKN